MRVFLLVLFFIPLSLIAKEERKTLLMRGSADLAPLVEKWLADYKTESKQKLKYKSLEPHLLDRELKRGQRVLWRRGLGLPAKTQWAKKYFAIPVSLEPVVVFVHLPEVKEQINLDAKTLAEIFTGKITSWDDGKIKALNPNVNLPKLAVIPSYPELGRGPLSLLLTYMGDELSFMGRKGRAALDPSSIFPTGVKVKTDFALVSLVSKTPGAIGVGISSQGRGYSLATAKLKNAAGEFVGARRSSLVASIPKGHGAGSPLAEIANSSESDAYPLTFLNYTFAPKHILGKSNSELVKFYKWILEKGQKSLPEFQAAEVPPAMARSWQKTLGKSK